jgi:hypothetical protein
MTQAQNVAELSSDINSSGVLQVIGGGTGSTTATGAANTILPSQTSNSGKYLTTDGTNTSWGTVTIPVAFPAGTVMLFAQTSAPTGWTKNTTTGDNSALRVTTGAASTGGTVGFTTAFASQAVSGSIANQTATNQAFTPAGSVSISSVAGSAGATTLSTPQIPSHNHSVTANYKYFGGGPTAWVKGYGAGTLTLGTSYTGGSGSHTHPFSFSSGSGSFTGTSATVTQNAHNHTFTGTAINLAVQYIDVIRASKD